MTDVVRATDAEAALDAALNDGMRHAAVTARTMADMPNFQRLSGPKALRKLADMLEKSLAHPDENRRDRRPG